MCVCLCVLFQWAVISKAMNFLSRKSHHCSFCTNQRVIGCQLEPHLNQCLQVFLTIRRTILWHHNTIPDKGRFACYAPYSDVSRGHFNQLVVESNYDGQICWWNSRTTQLLSHELQSPGWDVLLLSDPRQPITEVLCYSVGGPSRFPSPFIYWPFLFPSTTTPSICWSFYFYLPPNLFLSSESGSGAYPVSRSLYLPHRRQTSPNQTAPSISCACSMLHERTPPVLLPFTSSFSRPSPTSGERIRTQEKHWEAPW